MFCAHASPTSTPHHPTPPPAAQAWGQQGHAFFVDHAEPLLAQATTIMVARACVESGVAFVAVQQLTAAPAVTPLPGMAAAAVAGVSSAVPVAAAAGGSGIWLLLLLVMRPLMLAHMAWTVCRVLDFREARQCYMHLLVCASMAMGALTYGPASGLL